MQLLRVAGLIAAMFYAAHLLEAGVGGIVLVLAYMFPAVVASLRRHHNAAAIFMLNFLLGWTVLGWIMAMVWACTSPPPARATPVFEDLHTRTRQQPPPTRRLSSNRHEPVGSYVDPLVTRFRWWPYLLIVTTLVGVIAPAVYFNRLDRTQATSEAALSDASVEATGTLRRVGNEVVTAIPRTAPTAAPRVAPAERTHSKIRQAAATVDDSALHWVTSDRLNRRTCPDLRCGIVGIFFFREGTEILEESNGWARVSKYYDAYCIGGISKYVEAGNAACVAANGIVDGQFAEWVSMQHLSRTRPADPAAGATGDYALVRSSDDYARYKDVFARTAARLIADRRCSRVDFEETGGWTKSVVNHKDSTVYFTYCGGLSIPNRLYLNAATGEVFR